MFLLVRAARPEDARAIAAIYAPFVLTSTATLELEPPDAAEIERRMRSVQDAGLPYLVAEADGGVVAGYAYATAFRPRAGYRFTVEDSIYVRPDCVGYGVGKKLLSQLIQGCQEAGCHRMMACICGENPVSVGLHRSLGFETLGRIPEAGFKFDQWVDMAMMQRAL